MHASGRLSGFSCQPLGTWYDSYITCHVLYLLTPHSLPVVLFEYFHFLSREILDWIGCINLIWLYLDTTVELLSNLIWFKFNQILLLSSASISIFIIIVTANSAIKAIFKLWLGHIETTHVILSTPFPISTEVIIIQKLFQDVIEYYRIHREWVPSQLPCWWFWIDGRSNISLFDIVSQRIPVVLCILQYFIQSRKWPNRMRTEMSIAVNK